MADTTQLLTKLKEYRAALHHHRQSLQSEYDHLDQQWHRFRSVYEGDAARDFQSHWLRTCGCFSDYIAATFLVMQLLEERIAALEQLDRQRL